MPTKPYYKLSHQSQHLIDAAVFITEARRMFGINQPYPDDDHDHYQAASKLMVAKLRHLYTVDIQTDRQYFAWDNKGEINRDALFWQRNTAVGNEQAAPYLNALIDRLTNLPYPQAVERKPRQVG